MIFKFSQMQQILFLNLMHPLNWSCNKIRGFPLLPIFKTHTEGDSLVSRDIYSRTCKYLDTWYSDISFQCIKSRTICLRVKRRTGNKLGKKVTLSLISWRSNVKRRSWRRTATSRTPSWSPWSSRRGRGWRSCPPWGRSSRWTWRPCPSSSVTRARRRLERTGIPARKVEARAVNPSTPQLSLKLDLAQTYKAVSQFDCQIVVKLTSDPRPENRE